MSLFESNSLVPEEGAHGKAIWDKSGQKKNVISKKPRAPFFVKTGQSDWGATTILGQEQEMGMS